MQQFVDAGLDLRIGDVPHPHAEGDVLKHAHVLEQRIVLEHKPDFALASSQLGDVGVLDEIVPVSACSSPAMIRSSVVLPDPEGPSRASSEPEGTSSDTSLRPGSCRTIWKRCEWRCS